MVYVVGLRGRAEPGSVGHLRSSARAEDLTMVCLRADRRDPAVM